MGNPALNTIANLMILLQSDRFCNVIIVSDGLRKRGVRCKKSKGDHYLVCQKKVAEAVFSI